MLSQSYMLSVMRVIAGKFRSRKLKSLPGLGIRPTSDRLRETLFNVLTAGNAHALQGSVWVDLFAGTGAVGIEALSRGAAVAYFVESSHKAAALVQSNLDLLSIRSGYEILTQPAAKAVRQLEERAIETDFVFLDPPYRLSDAYQETLDILAESNLAKKALVIAEHEKHFDPGHEFGPLQRTRQLVQGDAVLSFYRHAAQE